MHMKPTVFPRCDRREGSECDSGCRVKMTMDVAVTMTDTPKSHVSSVQACARAKLMITSHNGTCGGKGWVRCLDIAQVLHGFLC